MKELFEVLEKVDFYDLTGVIAVAAYVLEAWALYTIAQRRWIKKPWLAWIPIVNMWILGSISDQYHYVTKREVKNKRKLLLGLNIALCAAAIAFLMVLIGLLVSFLILSGGTIIGFMPGAELPDKEFLLEGLVNNLGQLLLLIVMIVPLAGLAITSMVYKWIALYDLFRSCWPSKAKLFILISVFGGLAAEGVHVVFMMLCRNKDLGMPPRKPEVEVLPEQPVTEE